MAKIHTHYDNLKVARGAPQEVIRAAYKALSQKYHPDKNPGDEKAARIMAVVNSAYNTLSDPVRRKEHDEWIAAEEWEVEWLESTHADEVPGGGEPDRGAAQPRRYRASRDPKWWMGLGACFAAGCAVGAFVMTQQQLLPVALAAAPQAALRAINPVPAPATPSGASVALAEARPETAVDSWAAVRPAPPPSGAQALAVTQLVVPPRTHDCEADLYTLTAPNGEPWPAASGYVEGYPVGNLGGEMQVQVDNTANSSPVFVKVYDLDRRANVRHAWVAAHESLTIDKLAAGKYEVRYQNIEAGGSKAACQGIRPGLRQAGAGTPEI